MRIMENEIFNYIERDTIFFDIETTGTDLKKDRIVELCAIKYKKNGEKVNMHIYFNPKVDVSPKALELHGLSNEFLSDFNDFNYHSDEIYSFFDKCDLGGFNCITFDIPMLFEELSRCKKYLDIFRVNILDSYNLMSKFESRRLSDTYKRFFGKELDNSHSAVADTEATVEIFMEQLKRYEVSDMPVKELSGIIRKTSNDERIIDLSGWFRMYDNVVYYGKGKHKGLPVKEHLDYLEYFVSSDIFENNSRAIGKMLLNKFKAVKDI